MMKGIRNLFRGRDELETEEEDNTIENGAIEAVTVVCSSCGAPNAISNNSFCEYCGSPLGYPAVSNTAPSESATKTSTATKKASDLTNLDKEYSLSTGFYTAGIDIPIGICNVSAISGSGNISSSDYEINEVFGTERGDVHSYKGLKLSRGVILELSGRLTVQLIYKSVEDNFSGRNYNKSGAKEITTGNYVAGRHFPAGVYNIEAVSGSGNLSTDDVGINEVFGLDEEDVSEIKNVYLPKGIKLSLEGDMSIKLIPEGN